jgi:hypothetical protein
MAHRVATEYVNAKLAVPVSEMPRLIELCEAQQLRLKVCVLDNGNQEVALEEAGSGESIRLVFERVEGVYCCYLTCRVVQSKLCNALRILFQRFRGDAIVNRIYQGFTMVYHYKSGSVIRIVENRDGTERTIYEYRDSIGQIEAQFRLRRVEEEIERLKQSVNELLDHRNSALDDADLHEIDERLKYHSRMLFVLEA